MSETATRVRDRIAGGLLGLAACDAVGTAVEFMPPGSFPPVTGMNGGGKFSVLPGQVQLVASNLVPKWRSGLGSLVRRVPVTGVLFISFAAVD